MNDAKQALTDEITAIINKPVTPGEMEPVMTSLSTGHIIYQIYPPIENPDVNVTTFRHKFKVEQEVYAVYEMDYIDDSCLDYGCDRYKCYRGVISDMCFHESMYSETGSYEVGYFIEIKECSQEFMEKENLIFTNEEEAKMHCDELNKNMKIEVNKT